MFSLYHYKKIASTLYIVFLPKVRQTASIPISSSRPRNRPSPAALAASKRVASSTLLTRNTATGLPIPLRRWAPVGAISKRPWIRRFVPSATRISLGAASPCNRAARFGVSPRTARSSELPSPTMSPATTRPVATPMRTFSSIPPQAFNAPTASTRSSPARTARSGSSSCAWGYPKYTSRPSPMYRAM